MSPKDYAPSYIAGIRELALSALAASYFVLATAAIAPEAFPERVKQAIVSPQGNPKMETANRTIFGTVGLASLVSLLFLANRRD